MKDLSYGLIKSLCFSPLERAVLCVFIISRLKGSPVAAHDFFTEIGWFEPFSSTYENSLTREAYKWGRIHEGWFCFCEGIKLTVSRWGDEKRDWNKNG